MTITETMNANRGRCRSCGASVVWAITSKGGRMPVHTRPEGMKGNIQLRDDEAGSLRVVTVTPGDGPYVSHFAVCPNAQGHRRKGGRR